MLHKHAVDKHFSNGFKNVVEKIKFWPKDILRKLQAHLKNHLFPCFYFLLIFKT